jgi:hypothetical protein
MARKEVRRSGWSAPSWEAVAVLTGEQFEGLPRERTLLKSDGGVDQYLWTGFSLELYRDAAEAYWFNLTGTRPALFVICRSGEDGELVPFRVAADHFESEAAVEADASAFPAAIPAEILSAMEQLVMGHYRPEPQRKRKRREWTGTEGT